MRPTKQQGDLEYWVKSQEYWKKQEEFWFLEGAGTKDHTWSAECNRREEYARNRQFVADLAHQEARGDIIVYTGRSNPTWTRNGVFAV